MISKRDEFPAAGGIDSDSADVTSADIERSTFVDRQPGKPG